MTTTREEAIELAKEADFHCATNGDCTYDDLIRLIDLAKSKENEACAKVCDQKVENWCDSKFGAKESIEAAKIIALSIRARVKP